MVSGVTMTAGLKSTTLTYVEFSSETDSLGQVSVRADKLWSAQTQRSLEHFSIGKDVIRQRLSTRRRFSV